MFVNIQFSKANIAVYIIPYKYYVILKKEV